MHGLSRTTGKIISPLERIQQSIQDILTTPVGTRVLLGDYGSLLFDLIDQPLNNETLQKVRASSVDALKRWEPALSDISINISSASIGQLSIQVRGIAYGREITTDTIVGILP